DDGAGDAEPAPAAKGPAAAWRGAGPDRPPGRVGRSRAGALGAGAAGGRPVAAVRPAAAEGVSGAAAEWSTDRAAFSAGPSQPAGGGPTDSAGAAVGSGRTDAAVRGSDGQGAAG